MARLISGKAHLQCNACQHKWQEGYSVGIQYDGPNMDQLNGWLKKRKIVCPKCKHISFTITLATVSSVS